MSKILIVGDVHFSQYSSILRKRGVKYSQRLENILKSVNWVEETSKKNNCKAVIYLGDFFDKPSTTDEEITATRDIEWNINCPHYFIVGNHESSVNGLKYSSTKLLEYNFSLVVDKANSIVIDACQFNFLPYVIESDRKPITDYFTRDKKYKQVLISHNDLRGISFGAIVSTSGFDINEITNNFDLCINGHIHSGSWVNNKILNLGNLTGQNFGENADIYKHNIGILDTDSLQIELIENPFAYNFSQVDISSNKDIIDFKVKHTNPVINFKCDGGLVIDLKEKINELNLDNYRITSIKKCIKGGTELTLEHVDPNQKFKEFMLERLGNTEIVKQEILEVTK